MDTTAERIKQKPHRQTEVQFGDTMFTVISVESDRAKERLYDKVKRLIMNSEATTASGPGAA